MTAADERSAHEQAWLALPWLANGRLASQERAQIEEHARHCSLCEQELAIQERMYQAFNEPDRVIYAPGPSLRKLMARIDRAEQKAPAQTDTPVRVRGGAAKAAGVATRLGQVSLWRPPGLAWAATFILFFGMTGLIATAYRWSEPAFRTHTDRAAVRPEVLHIAVDRSLTIGDEEAMLRAAGARVVEGPGSTGILGVAPVGVTGGQTPTAVTNRRLRELAARLRTDSRVLWIQPLSEDDATPADERAASKQEH